MYVASTTRLTSQKRRQTSKRASFKIQGLYVPEEMTQLE